jgi:uncharacterized Zn finger protein
MAETQTRSSNGRPLTAHGGIRAQTKSRKVGKNWWTKRWMAVLENHYMGAELPRGRAYAQAGQVLALTIENGTVKATVQGAREKPHKVEIKFKAAPKKQWEALTKLLSSQAIFAAKLLSGQMPESIEEVFEEQGIALFPKDIDDLETHCTSKSEGLCRHIIAVYYILAEEFDRDPFLFMRLRGLEREKLIKDIGSSVKRNKRKKSAYLDLELHSGPRETPTELTHEVTHFWNGGTINEDHLTDVRIPPSPGSLSKHLGHFPMWRGEERFLDALELVYKKASNNGMNVFMGDW